MHPDSGIPVRRSTRHEIVLPVRLSVAAEHRKQVQFGHGVADSDGCVEADLIDLSRGGCGVLSTHFFPKPCKVRMRVYGLDGVEGPTLIDGHVRIQRITMTDSRPGYLLGLSFSEGDDVFDHDLGQLLRRLDNDTDAPPPGREEAA
ncbi:MAG: PilZ domain-containing protein [Phycisphaerales bacterium]|nr:PilZ domain-containing protein [Phycisphaerales bacterium]